MPEGFCACTGDCEGPRGCPTVGIKPYYFAEDDCWYSPLLVDYWQPPIEYAPRDYGRADPATVRRDTSVVANTGVVFAGFWSLP